MHFVKRKTDVSYLIFSFVFDRARQNNVLRTEKV